MKSNVELIKTANELKKITELNDDEIMNIVRMLRVNDVYAVIEEFSGILRKLRKYNSPHSKRMKELLEQCPEIGDNNLGIEIIEEIERIFFETMEGREILDLVY